MKLFAIILLLNLFVCHSFASELTDLLKQDQAAREKLRTLPRNEIKTYIDNVMLKGDIARRSRVEEILKSAQAFTSDEYMAAAMIMQHGNDAEHYRRAKELAQLSVQTDPNNHDARWLVCASEDRYLLKSGKLQIWGTQIKRKKHEAEAYDIYYQPDYDSSVKTDLERQGCNLPPLKEIKSRLNKMATVADKSEQYAIWKGWQN